MDEYTPTAVARLLLESLAETDAGCVPCVQGVIDSAVFHEPGLPWEAAAEQLKPESLRDALVVAVSSSRSWIASGGAPREVASGTAL